jgi:hypothetical protein
LSNAPNNTTTTTTTMLRNFNDSSSNMRRPVCYRPTVKRFLTFHQLRRSGSALQPDRRARHCPYDPTCPLLHSPRHQHGSISYRNFGRWNGYTWNSRQMLTKHNRATREKENT